MWRALVAVLLVGAICGGPALVTVAEAMSIEDVATEEMGIEDAPVEGTQSEAASVEAPVVNAASAETAAVGAPLVRATAVEEASVEAPVVETTSSEVASVEFSSDEPRIVEVYPNTVTHGNVGEYVVISVPEPTDVSGWTLTDGKTTAALPNQTVSGRLALSTDPAVTELLTTDPVGQLDGHLALAVAGDTVELRNESDAVVHVTTYENAPRAHRWLETDSGWEWRAAGATTFEPTSHPVDSVEAFVLPDEPSLPLATLASAEERLLLAGYTFTSDAVADELVAAHRRGVTVHVLVDGSPVGGQTTQEAAVLDRLVAAGIPVVVSQDDRGRYRFHHAKYAVVDDTVLVLTENWKPSGTDGRSSRGWGIAVESEAVTADLVALFEADTGWRDAISWQRYRLDRSFVDASEADGTFPTEFEAEAVTVDTVRVVSAPDNAEAEISALLRSANRSIRVQQPAINDLDHPYVRASLDAARDGAAVQLLLDDTWYVERENREFARAIHEIATRESLSVEVRLVEPRSRFEKVHSKGIVIDDRTVVVGSVNWNNNSIRNNREVALVLEGESVGSYYANVFQADWRGGRWLLPVGMVGAVGGACVGALVIARRTVRFEGT